jgi:threonine synthase
MRYISTRGSSERIDSAQAIIRGLATDKGLYVPTELPVLNMDYADMAVAAYKDIAHKVMKDFLEDFTYEELQKCVVGAYDEKFDSPKIAPLIKAGDIYFLELYHGRTAAFKDMALSILPYLLTTAIRKEREEKKIVILTATSGDTGKAALEGFADVHGTEIIVFYPKDGVSMIQERQMTTQRGNNTHVFSVAGNFDDAQTSVKSIFNDEDFAAELASRGYKLSSANSINIGRLVPQVAYYVYAYIQLIDMGGIKAGETANIVVPTGNFGNILAAWYAREMGLPIGKLICASNENKVLTDFIRTGDYDANRRFHLTSSPSMDILISSNLERLLWHLSGGDSVEIAGYMQSLEQNGSYTVSDRIREALRTGFYGGYAEMPSVHQAISDLWQSEKYLMDTHTAVGYSVYADYRKESGDTRPAIIASTASAYKFADTVSPCIGLPAASDGFASIDALHKTTGISIPAGLRGLNERPITQSGSLSADEMKDAIRELLS